MYDFLIVGAGLTGAVLARELTDAGKTCLVIDRRDHIAGNCYTENVSGINVHKYGAHIFHTDDEQVWNYIGRFAKFNNYINSPIAIFHDEIYNLPFNMNTFAKMWNVATPAQAREIIEKQKAEAAIDGEPKNLEEQALSLVGKDIFEKLIKEYTEKQWGRDCKELPADIIKRLPVRYTYDNNYFNHRFQGIPEGGYTAMVEKMLDGIEVKTGVSFSQADLSGFKHVIYTGPVDEYFDFRLGQLEWRSVR
ncbi:MAG: NAD(P)-binding protein, partial [Bifidobacteriaceae bacterium]|nr:NAD(P)-binding protein [Bifidobacteriaceae bacterium]